jgi:hypothetical protein
MQHRKVHAVKSKIAYLHCGDQLRKTLALEIAEVESVVAAVKWAKLFQYSDNSTVLRTTDGFLK